MSRNLKIFAVADKINGNGLMMSGTAYTAGAFIRDSLPYFKHRGFDFMNEGLLYEIGEFSEDTFSIVIESILRIVCDSSIVLGSESVPCRS